MLERIVHPGLNGRARAQRCGHTCNHLFGRHVLESVFNHDESRSAGSRRRDGAHLFLRSHGRPEAILMRARRSTSDDGTSLENEQNNDTNKAEKTGKELSQVGTAFHVTASVRDEGGFT